MTVYLHRLAVLSTLAIAGTACRATQPTRPVAERVADLSQTYALAFERRFPDSAVIYGVVLPRHDGLTDLSLDSLRSWQQFEDSLWIEVASIPEDSLLDQPEWAELVVLREKLASARGLRVCRRELWPVDHFGGWHTYLPLVASAQPVGTDSLRAQALTRWHQLPRYLDQQLTAMREGIRLGYTSPRRITEIMAGQLDELLRLPLTESPFFDPARRDSTPSFRQAWTELLEREITPAIRQNRDFLAGEYLAAARPTTALVDLPDGAACYRAALRDQTSLDIAPEELNRRGLLAEQTTDSMVVVIGRAMFGLDDRVLIARRLQQAPTNRFRNRAEMLASIQAAVIRARAAMPQAFADLPDLPVRIEPVPRYLEATATSSYVPAPKDNTRPATYNANLYRPEDQARGNVERVAFHEVWPGHHLQAVTTRPPPRPKGVIGVVWMAGFSEGWGRYAEGLAAELGLYSSDIARLEQTYRNAGTAMRFDIGVHAMRWSRDTAIAYWRNRFPMMSVEAAGGLFDRSVAYPAQLASYDAGGLEIFALRAEARRALGDQFDLRAFHRVVLEDGGIPLAALRWKVERWIARERDSQ